MKPAQKAFTLLELMVVVIIVGIVASFGIPNYTRSLDKARRKDAESNLQVIHAAQQIYIARHNNVYFGPGNLAQINSNLMLNIVANGTTYSCNLPGLAPPSFTCSAVRGPWTVTITSASAVPNCFGTCP
jgi:prepilin-type N-terminal cleavage/methylation domain-containing protein